MELAQLPAFFTRRISLRGLTTYAAQESFWILYRMLRTIATLLGMASHSRTSSPIVSRS